MRLLTSGAGLSESWIDDDVRRLLGALGPHARIFNVYSAGDSGEGCELVEFTTPSSGGPIPWTARVFIEDGIRFTECTAGW